MKICKPYANCNITNISQPFGGNHTGVDFATVRGYGKFLVAPEDCYIDEIITDETFDMNYWKELEKGYGILMRSSTDPTVKYLYWHCMQIFPVKKGQLVKQGEAVAQMGNSGFCMSGGKVVPLDIRTIPPYKGTHLHYEKRVNGKYVNPVPSIDFNLPVKISTNQWIQQVIINMVDFINKKII